MRSPTPSFRSELAAYQRQLVEITKAMDGCADPRSEIAIGIVDRWLDHPEAEGIWSELRSCSPAFQMTPAEFACGVISRRLLAERVAEIQRDGPSVVQNVKRKLKHALAKSDTGTLVAGSVPLHDFVTRRPRVFAREKGADRTWFMWQCAEDFRSLCGKPLDNVVRVLAQIAFDWNEASLDHVRGAQRTMARLRRDKGHRDTRPPK
jgi:hypothetical protein